MPTMRLTLLLIAMLALTACGDDPGEEPSAGAPPTLDPPMLDWVRSVASESQLDILEKGYVTFAEYERAILDAVACFEEEGIETEVTFNEAAMLYDYAARIPDGPQLERLHEHYLSCTAEHLDAILDAWVWQQQKSEEELQAARQALAQCLRESGIDDFPESPTSADFSAVIESDLDSFIPCSERISDEFGLPNFAG